MPRPLGPLLRQVFCLGLLVERSLHHVEEPPQRAEVAGLRGLDRGLGEPVPEHELRVGRAQPRGELRGRRQALEQLERQTRERLAEAEIGIKLRGSVEENPNYAFVVEALQARAVAIQGLKSKEAKEVELLKTTGESLAKLSSLRPRWQGLQLEARQKRENADRLLTTVTNMRAVRRLEQQKLSNLQVMHAATLEQECVGPGRTKQALLGGFVGGFLGISLRGILENYSGTQASSAVSRVNSTRYQRLNIQNSLREDRPEKSFHRRTTVKKSCIIVAPP